MENQQYEDEIDLRDYIKVVVNRKWTIFVVFFLCVITAAIVSFLMPKVYEATSKIQLGSTDRLLMRKEEVKEIFLSRNSLMPIIKELNLDIGLKQFEKTIKVEDIKDTNLLKIKVQYPDADMAVKINKAIANSFISQGQAIYKERISLINERLKELEEENKNIEGDIRRTQNLITKFSSSGGISQKDISLRIILLQNTLPNCERHLYTLKNRRNELKTLLSKTKDFEILELPLKPKYSIKPNKRLNVAISGVLGLMLGVFIAFFKEFWEKNMGNKE